MRLRKWERILVVWQKTESRYRKLWKEFPRASSPIFERGRGTLRDKSFGRLAVVCLPPDQYARSEQTAAFRSRRAREADLLVCRTSYSSSRGDITVRWYNIK
jgi:hypothetical protein